MNKKATQVLLSISLASFISCAQSTKSSPERTKRSFYSRPVPLLLPYPWQPGKLKHERHELLKRNGLSLDFIDSLLNDPMFAEPGDDYQDDSFLHGNTFNEVTNHDDNSFLHGNTFNEVNNDENNMLAQVLAPEKDPMSNVIPGAQGPYHIPDVSKPTPHQQQVADHLMDDFLLFLSLKDLGMLEMCFGDKR